MPPKGSHTYWKHPLLPLTIPGKDGDDATIATYNKANRYQISEHESYKARSSYR